jgi:hypothetical protein
MDYSTDDHTLRSAERQRNHAGYDRSGCREPPRCASFSKYAATHSGADDAYLSGRSDVADWGKHQRREHQQIGERAEYGHAQDLGAVSAPSGSHLIFTAQRHGGKEQSLHREGRPQVEDWGSARPLTACLSHRV